MLKELVPTPLIDSDTEKKFGQMTSSMWKDWQKRGKWYSVLVTLGSHFVLDRVGKPYVYETDRDAYKKYVEGSKLVEHESRKVNYNPKDKIKYSYIYTESVFDFLIANFVEGDSEKIPNEAKWIYRTIAPHTQQQIFFKNPSSKFTMPWPDARDVTARTEEQQERVYFNTGKTDKTWYTRLKLMQAERGKCKAIL